MMRAGIALILLGFSTAATAGETDWGIREYGKPVKRTVSSKPPSAVAWTSLKSATTNEPLPAGTWAMDPQPTGKSVDMGSVKQIGAQWGRVTSTYRSPEHNRRVGGVANSYHLRNRAIDIARSPGVRHSQIVAAYRNAGYSLAEALDEGDHTHIAFGAAKHRGIGGQARIVPVQAGEKTEWRIVYAPPSSGGGN